MNRYCVIGEKLTHTLSPSLHNHFFDCTKINGTYDVVEISKEDIRIAKKKLLEFDGINVTIPYKQEVMNFLDEISPEAKAIGAVNTIKNIDGKLYGFNTDPFGFGAMLEYNQVDIKGKICVILGSGGASKAVKYHLQTSGAKQVYIVSRKAENGKIDYDDLAKMQGDILINATPIGMYPNIQACPVNNDIISKFDCIVDIVYNPLYSELLKRAVALNKKAVGGLYMLVAQAVKSQSIWQSKTFDAQLIKSVYLATLKDYFKTTGRNIYLTGIMSSGKSTIGKMLAKECEMTFIDADNYIEGRENKTIKELFAISESYFRDCERKAMLEISQMKNTVVACGGGAILSDSNVSAMRLSGLTFMLDKEISLIAKDLDAQNRPLLRQGMVDLERIYKERKDRYFYANEYVISNNETPQIAVEKIRSLL